MGIANAVPTSYARAKELLDGRPYRTLSPNTELRMGVDKWSTEPLYIVRLHATDIVQFDAAGYIELNSGGYWTVTTKRRMNQCLAATPWRVVQEDFQWFLWNWKTNAQRPFQDGMAVIINTVTPA